VIPVDKIIPKNLYSQDDALFLLGDGFTKDAAKEAVCEASRSGALVAQQWRKRWWFTGAEYLKWVSTWFGSAVGRGDDVSPPPDVGLAPARRRGQDRAHRLGARAPENGEEVGA